MPKILSTLTASTDYIDFIGTVGNGANVPGRRVTVKGGANVASAPHALASGILTPGYHVTHVTDEELELLQRNDLFKLHEQNGFVKVVKDSEADKKVVRDMEKADPSAPFTEADYKEGGRAQTKKAKSEETGEEDKELKVKTGKAK